MAVHDSMRAAAVPFLRPEETIQAVVPAQRRPSGGGALGAFGALGGIVVAMVTRYRIIVATDQRILVLDTGKMGVKRARGVVVELPRSTKLGPASGIWQKIQLDGEQVRVHRKFFKDIAAADTAITEAA
jgi:hypothetical protein